MRVIAGVYRGRRLRSPAGLAVRPTSDRLRETLFNVLARRIEGSRFLDICAGSGAVGIEALSRGASEVSFIERSRRACAAIEMNLKALGVEKEPDIINRDAVAALAELESERRQVDIAFLDPPYASEIYNRVMNRLGSGRLLAGDALVIVEHRAKTAPAHEYGKLRIVRELNQGESALAFYEAEAERSQRR